MPRKGSAVEITLTVPVEVKDAFRSLYAIAEHDSAIRGRLREWMEDRHGPVLAAHGYTGDRGDVLHATLEFTKPFAEFLAASGADARTHQET